MTKSKRLRVTLIALTCNFILFGLGIYMGADLTALGAGLAMLNAPLYGYLWGETSRPSGLKYKDYQEIGNKKK